MQLQISLYNEIENVILDMEFMIVNKSTDNLLTIKIIENNVETLNDTLECEEVQRYKLTSTTAIKMYIKGNYELYLYVQYI